MSGTDATAAVPIERPKRSVRDSLPVLIEVPATTVPRISRCRSRSSSGTRRWSSYVVAPRPASRRRTRRLRREVRTAARVVTLGIAMCLVWGFGSSSPGTPVLAMQFPQSTDQAGQIWVDHAPAERPAQVVAPTPKSDDDSQIVMLSAEPALTTPRPDAEVPVVLPGYVLPDDSREESSHEGS